MVFYYVIIYLSMQGTIITLKSLGLVRSSAILFFIVMCGIVVHYSDVLITKADNLHDFLLKKYPDKLKSQNWDNRLSFPLHTWMTTFPGLSHGVLYQFKVLSLVKTFNIEDSELQSKISKIRSDLTFALGIVFIIFLSALLVTTYFGFFA